MIYKHFAAQSYTACLAPALLLWWLNEEHAFISIFVVGHQRIILTGVLPIAICQSVSIMQKHLFVVSVIQFNSRV